MALTGLQIFKYLPGGKKEKEANCKKCGFPTCMAFAMKLAKKETVSDKCEYISDELKVLLEEASQVQQMGITFGPQNNQVKVGNETVMFRHDKKFVNQTCIAVKLESTDPDFDKKLKEIEAYSVERVGEVFRIDAIAFIDWGSDFLEKAVKINNLGIPMILVSSNSENIRSVLAQVKDSKPLVFLKNDDASKIAAEFNVPVVISADNIESLVDKSGKAIENKAENIVLNLETENNLIEGLTYIRRAAIEDKFKPLGFPVITFMQSSCNIFEEAIAVSTLVCKYSNIVVLNNFNKALISSLFTLKQNIFTDPQKPLQIEPKLYPVGETTPDSPIFITTNFALTYFSVVSEIESSGIPAYLLITPSDGMSVLTAWAANKFTGEIIAKAVTQNNLNEIANHKRIVIPGYVGNLKEEIEEELPDWEIITGPNEAVDIVHFLKEMKAKDKALNA